MAAGKLQAVVDGAESRNSAPANALHERLVRGELDIDAYLEARVEEAIAPLTGKVPADRVDWLKAMLRDQLACDPVLSERVRQATGREPRSP